MLTPVGCRLTYLTRGVDSTTIVAAGRAHTPSGHTRVATCGTVRGPGDCGRAGLNSLKHYGTRSLVAVVGATPPYTSDVRRAPGCGSRLVSGALLYSSRLVPSYLFTGAAQGSPRSLSVRPAWWPCWCSAAGQRHGPGRRHVSACPASFGANIFDDLAAADGSLAAAWHERGHTDSIMKMMSKRAAATREHLVRRLHVSGERPDTLYSLDTRTLIPTHVRDAHSWARVHLTHNLQYFRAQVTAARSSSSPSSRAPTPLCSAVRVASILAAGASSTDTTVSGPVWALGAPRRSGGWQQRAMRRAMTLT